MKTAKKITLIFSLFALLILSNSCKRQCFNNEEFDVSSVVLDSYPTSDGINGSYDSETGGQISGWHNTGLRSNGDMFLIKISGSWTSWNGGTYNALTDSELEGMEVCRTCAKKDANTPNCICYASETPSAEERQICNSSTDQNNPGLCTCTKDPQYGTALDYDVYHFPLGYFTKNEVVQDADKQKICKFTKGMGAYIALFGSNGVTDPQRVYHLFTDDKDVNGNITKVCDIVTTTPGACTDSLNKDRYSYYFRSANNRIFMRDDGEGNTGTNIDTSNDTYHGPNEVVKVKIYDQYYNDNYGKYNLDILRGVGDSSDIDSVGILEYMVRLVENVLLGDIVSKDIISQVNGEEVVTKERVRQGGIIEKMYKGIVQDSVFVIVLQITMILYVAFFGLATLMGIAEINKKELMSRTLKISLVMFFTSESSWYWYNKLVVGFFYDSMNYVVSMFMSISDTALTQRINTSSIVIAQMDRAIDLSNATRFSYVDNMIKTMLSSAFAAKVFSLIFSTPLSILYIYLIYRILVFNFIKTMVHVATLYLINMIKIIFVLCLGPIFITFSLFAHTKNMFQNWLTFLGSRSLEIILIFVLLYNFVMLIDLWIRDLLDYSACVEPLSFGLGIGKVLDSAGLGGFFSINVLKASGIGDRTVFSWLIKIAKIAALIFITKLFLDKVMSVAGALISIGGVKGGDGQSGATIAGGLAGGLNNLANKLAGKTDMTSSRASAAASFIGKTSSNILASNMGGMNPFKSDLNPIKAGREAARNAVLDPIINQAKKDVANMKGADGKPLSGIDAAKAIRDKVAQQYVNNNSKVAGALGITPEKAAARVDQLFAKQLANDLKAKGLMGDELKNQLKAGMQAYADKIYPKGSSDSKASNKELMASLASTIKKEGNLSSKEAAKLYADKPDLQNKYNQHLQDQAFKRSNRQEQMGSAQRIASKGLDGLARAFGIDADKRNPEAAQQSFIRNLDKNQNPGDGTVSGFLSKLDPTKNSNSLNRLNDFLSGKENSLDKRTDETQKNILRDSLAQDQKAKSLPPLRNGASEKEKENYAAALKKLGETAEKKRHFFQQQLRNLATKDLAKDVKKINDLAKKGKISEASSLKRDLLKKEQDSLKTNNGLTTFEKAARLDYLHKKFGIAGDDPTTKLSKALNQSAKDLKSEIDKKIANGAKIHSLIDDISSLSAMRSGLFTKDPQPQLELALNEIANKKVPEFGISLASDNPETRVKDNISINDDKNEIRQTLDDMMKNLKEAAERQKDLEEEERKKDFKDRQKANMDIAMESINLKVASRLAESDEEKKELADKSQAKMQELKEKLAKDALEMQEIKQKNIENLENAFKKFEALENKNSPEALIIAHSLSQSIDAFVKAPASTEKEVQSQLGGAIKESVNSDSKDSPIPGLKAPDIGLKASDLGLSEPDIGLKASNFLLGTPNETNTGKSESEIRDLRMQKTQINGQLKLNNMNLKLKQFELDYLQKSGGEQGKIAVLKSEISEIEKEISHLERDEKSVEDKMK